MLPRTRSGRTENAAFETMPNSSRWLRIGAIGALGTPLVEEFAHNELGILEGIHPFAAQQLMADAVNLRHRHPQLWSRLQAGEVVGWVAQKTARMVAAAELDVNEARWVDAATCGAVAELPPARYFALVEAKIIEANVVKAERRREFEAERRYVRAGQSSELGLKTLVARALASDIIFFLGMVDRIAEILALRGDLDSVDVRRSRAIGVLASPVHALQLLAWAARPEAGDAGPQSTGSESTVTDTAQVIADRLAEVEPVKLLPPAVLYLHLSEQTLRAGVGVVRCEGVGPLTVSPAQDFLRHCHVTIKPVIDLNDQRPVDAYEVPARLGEAVRLQMPFEAYPWATRSSRGVDLDHAKPYSHRGPPGQTRTSNLGPLIRRHHRLKTHAAGWRLIQPSDGIYLWRSPTGYWVRIDHRGTHRRGHHISVVEEHFAALLGR